MHAPAGPFDTSSDMHMRAVLNVGVRGISAVLHGVRGRSVKLHLAVDIDIGLHGVGAAVGAAVCALCSSTGCCNE